MASAPLSAVALVDARQNNVPAWRVTLNGEDLTDRIAPRLLSLSISQKRASAADELDLVLHDHDGLLAIPAKGAELDVSIGWLRGTGVRLGLVPMGRFKVDEATHDGPPDKVTIRARSADLAGNYRIRRDASHKATTLGALARNVAARHGLKPAIAPELASIEISIVEQSAESDMAMIRRLGRRHDAVATVKAGKLILSPIGRGSSVSGRPFASVTLTRADGDRHSYARLERGQYDGVTASWHDQDGAARRTEHAGDHAKPKRLKTTYASAADARQAAAAEWRRIQRGAATFDYELALGRPDLAPEQSVVLRGWKAEIDAHRWLIAEVAHRLAGTGGFTTSLKLETAA